MYVLYYLLGILAWNGQAAFSLPTTYDQRQTGDVNVQIQVEDVQVVALVDSELLDSYTDYDYAYDYADFTIKPILKPTTSSSGSSSTTIKPWITWPTNPSTTSSPSSTSPTSLSINSTISNSSETQIATTPKIPEEQVTIKAESDVLNMTSKLRINDKAGNEQLFEDEEANNNAEQATTESITTTTNNKSETKKKTCPNGYILNRKGRCRSNQFRRRLSLMPLTMKLGKKFLERGNFDLGKDLPIRVYKSDPQN